MKEQLYSRGFSEQDVVEMTPQRAHELLTQGPTNNTEIPPRSPAIKPDPTEAPAKPLSPRVNGVAHAHFDSEISLKDIVDEPLVSGKVHCPFHDDTNPSCHIYDDHYHCFACGAHGDAIDWLREVEGLSFRAAQDALAYWEPRERSTAAREDDGKTLARALLLWDEAGPITGTLAIDYLAFRHIDVDQLTGGPEEVLRFHPNCPFDGTARVPCLLALYKDIDTDAFAGIHRIALTPSAFTHIPGSVKRRMLGRWAPRRRAVKLWPAKRELVLGEGLETTLATATRIAHHGYPLRPAWAMLSAGAIERCGPIAGVEFIVLLADNEPAGQRATRKAAQLLSANGCKTAVLKPAAVKDFNDLVRARAGA
jgi:Toprim domain/CHC2 zinc finger